MSPFTRIGLGGNHCKADKKRFILGHSVGQPNLARAQFYDDDVAARQKLRKGSIQGASHVLANCPSVRGSSFPRSSAPEGRANSLTMIPCPPRMENKSSLGAMKQTVLIILDLLSKADSPTRSLVELKVPVIYVQLGHSFGLLPLDGVQGPAMQEVLEGFPSLSSLFFFLAWGLHRRFKSKVCDNKRVLRDSILLGVSLSMQPCRSSPGTVRQLIRRYFCISGRNQCSSMRTLTRLGARSSGPLPGSHVEDSC